MKLAAGIAAAALLSGGSAWALSGGVAQLADIDETTTTSFDDSATTTTTSFDDSTTTTSFEVSTTTTTSFDGQTTTTTSFENSTTTTVAACKPGWGYGDKNHCHSGPPGKQKHP